MRTCFEWGEGTLAITLEQRSDLTFRVTYGREVTDNLNYSRAAAVLGSCIMHALACEDVLDNSGT